MSAAPLLSLRGVSKRYPVGAGFLRSRALWLEALAGIDLDLYPHETLGLVGESGCGKSTLSRVALGLEKPSAGRVFFEGQDLSRLSPGQLRALRPRMQIVFQDPATSLNPKMTVEQIVREPFIIHGQRQNLDDKVAELLRAVGLTPEQGKRYPHQFSGGQRQRVGIARALALRPRLLLADEPVSALDVSIQAQILNLLQDLKETFGLTYLFIAHDLAVVTHLATRLAVMYLGKIVEIMPPAALHEPERLHPYSQGLWNAAPSLAPRPQQELLKGEMPSPLSPPPGCRFHTRCPLVVDICRREEPPLKLIAPGHSCACHLRPAPSKLG